MVKRFNGAPYNINFQASQMLLPIASSIESSSSSSSQSSVLQPIQQAVLGGQQPQPLPQKIFVTNYPCADFIFQNLHEKLMIVDAVVVHSAFSTQQSGYPIGQGLIFTANAISFFDIANWLFEDMQFEQYGAWREQRRNNSHSNNQL